MIIYDKTRIKPLKINGKYVIIKYDDWSPNKYELYFDDEVNSFYSKLYIYNLENQYYFGEYIEYRNVFTDLANINIRQRIFDFLLKNTTNVETY
jgi:hypothetical protein